jgi:hypothetical protein
LFRRQESWETEKNLNFVGFWWYSKHSACGVNAKKLCEICEDRPQENFLQNFDIVLLET